ncbi:MAG: efflux RND transporter permease subunit [Alphaproteobacteria bacterium]|nr:efflux RND transporter permease subunit [Alphaproteobacteria bacterium]
MTKLVSFFTENLKLTLVLSLFMIFIGVVGLQRMKAETFPSVDFATAIVTTVYRGASASTIETKITKPIEDEIRTVRYIKDVKSVSQPGISRIIIRLDMDASGIDIPQTMGDLQRAIDRAADLPKDLENKPAFFELKSEEFPVLMIALSGDPAYTREELSDTLKDFIEENKDVKSVGLEGYSDREFQVILNANSIQQKYVGINEILDKIATRNLNIPTGILKGDGIQKLTRVEATVTNLEDLENLVVRSTFSGGLLKIKDLATVQDSRKEKNLMTGYNGRPTTVLSVTKKAGVDTNELVADVKQKLNSFSKRHPEFDFKIFYDESTKITSRLHILMNNAISGLIVIILTLFFFLPWRTAISTSLSLPIALMATLGVMAFMGVNLNTMTILALVIALGMLLDDNVVIAENFVRLREQGKSRFDAAVTSVKKLWLPITATALTTIAAFLPMLVTKGIMGRFIQWIPITVSLALTLSLIECFFFLPMRLRYFANPKVHLKRGEEADWFVKYEKKFERLILWLIQRRKKVLAGFFGIIIFSFILLFGANKFILFPSNQTEIYIGRYLTPKGTRIENTLDLGLELSKKIKQSFGDRAPHIVVKAGRTDDQVGGPNYREGANCGSLYIYVDEIARNDIPHTDFLKTLYAIKMDGFEDLSFEAQVNGPPVGSAIDVKFRSNSLDQLNAMIEKIKHALEQEKGVFDLKVDDSFSEDEVFIQLDYEKVDRLGLTVNQISQAVRTAIAGTVISDITLDNKKVDLFVRFKEESRGSVDSLKNIKVLNKMGYLVPLSEIATFKESDATPYVKRYDYKRTKSLVGQVDDIHMTSQKATALIQTLFEKYTADYPEVSLSFKGATESRNESMESLGSAFKISLIAIFALLVFLFKSYLKPILILTAIPLGLFGISLGFFIQGIPLSFMAMIGIVGLTGIIINSAIVLTSTILDLEEEGKVKKKKLLPYASSMRLRSVLITAFTTIAGLFPTAYGIGGFDALISPLTMAIVWGLSFGTILTLMWLPCGYALLEDLNIWSVAKSRLFIERGKQWLKKQEI